MAVCLVVQEFADALMDLKNAIVEIQNSKTLRKALGTLLAIGNFLNGREVRTYGMNCTRNYEVIDRFEG